MTALFSFCPACASPKIAFENSRMFTCPDCDFVYYHNTAAAAACIIESDAGLVFLVRNNDPGKGKLDLPGGFIDPGEGVFEGLYRELREELGWMPPLRPTLVASFPNVYPYKNIPYNTCDLIFAVRAPGLRAQDLRLERGEIAAVRCIKPHEIDYDEIAFDSIRRAVQAYVLPAAKKL